MAAETWDRIEPSCTSKALEPGLRAEVADPLWLLARQWQFGEFTGDDAASPIQVRLRTRTHRIRAFHTDGLDRPAPLPPNVPLEGLVEADPLEESVGLRVETGVALARGVVTAGFPDPTATLHAAFPVSLAEDDMGLIPPRIRRRLELFARHGCDGLAALAASDAKLAQALSIPRNRVAAILEPLRRSLAKMIRTPPGDAYSWQRERLEHSFSLRVALGDREASLEANEYFGGHLDWHDFDLKEDVGPASKPDPGEVREIATLPGPVSFSGAPAQRWWEFEEGQVRFGEMSSGPADVIRLVVAEFASVFSDDWRMIPVRVPAGSLTRVERLDVLDSFGRKLRIRSTVLQDQRRRPGPRVWRFFELAGDVSVENDQDPWLLLAPASPASQHSEPIERVVYLRDEGANLAWAVEETLESPDGRAYRRPRTTPNNARLASTDPAELWSYELPRGGLEVTRAWQWARATDGSAHLWVARTKRPGHGEKGSGLAADRIVAADREAEE